MSNLTPDAIISRGDEHLFTIVDGETVLMKIEDGTYYGLDEIGTRIWTLIETPRSLGALCEQLVTEFNVEREACEADVTPMLERMVEQHLIHIAPTA